jgi:tetratricopeptide (TPR) repeat protein
MSGYVSYSFKLIGSLGLVVVALLAVDAGRGPVAVQARGTAPLDTLIHEEPENPWIRFNRNNSRKVLPDVEASTVPQTTAPRRPPRLDDPVQANYQFHLAQVAAGGGNFELAREKMQLAHQAEPGQTRLLWWQTVQALREFDPGTYLWALPKAVRTAIKDPLARKRLTLQGHQAALLWLALFWSVLVAAYLLRYWSFLSHDLSALVFREPDHRLRGWLTLIIPLGVLCLRPGWLPFLAMISIPLCIKARGKARWPLLTVWIALTLLLFPKWAWIQQSLPVLDPRSETSLLVKAGRLPASVQMRQVLLQRLDEVEDPERRQRLLLACGVQAARSGAYEQSSEFFREILDRNPGHVAARVGLANNTYYLGRFDAALQEYAAARTHAPYQPEIPYNMAQAYFRKLFLPEAEQTMKEARALGFEPPAWEDSSGEANGFTPVVYLGFTNSEVYASAAAEAEYYPVLTHLAAWRHWLGWPPFPLFALLLVSLAVALGLTYGWSEQRDPRECECCGWIICSHCTVIFSEKWLCQKCGQTAERSKSEMVMATLLKNRSRSQGIARAQRVSWLARAVPGAGHLALDRMVGALLRIGLVTLGLYLVLFAWAFDPVAKWELPGVTLASETIHPYWFPFARTAWSGVVTTSFIGGSLLLIALFLVAQLDGAQMRQSLPKQFLIATIETDHKVPAAARKLA